MTKKMMAIVAVLAGLTCTGCAIVPALLMGTLGVGLVGGITEGLQLLAQILFGSTFNL